MFLYYLVIALILAILSWACVSSFVVFFNEVIIILLGLNRSQTTFLNNRKTDPNIQEDDNLNPSMWLILSLIYLVILTIVLWVLGVHLHDIFGMNIEAITGK